MSLDWSIRDVMDHEELMTDDESGPITETIVFGPAWPFRSARSRRRTGGIWTSGSTRSSGMARG